MPIDKVENSLTIVPSTSMVPPTLHFDFLSMGGFVGQSSLDTHFLELSHGFAFRYQKRNYRQIWPR